MTAEFVTPPDPALALERKVDEQIAQVEQLAALIERLEPICVRLAKSGVLPPALRDPGNLMLVALQGMSVGFTPLQAIRAAFVVIPKDDSKGGQPKVGWYTEALVALVRGSSRCKLWRVTGDHLEATVVTQRTDESEPHTITLTMKGAVDAGMTREWVKDGSGQPQPRDKFTWKANGAAMLSWAVQRLVCHRHYQDVMFGMPDEETIAISEIAADSAPGVTVRPITRAPAVTVNADGGAAIHDAELVDPPVPDPIDDAGGGAVALNSDPAWLEILEAVATWLPESRPLEWNLDDFLEEWLRQIDACITVAALNKYSAWLSFIGDRTSKSPAARELYTRASTHFNKRSRELKRGGGRS
jgi:hypothetical protein